MTGRCKILHSGVAVWQCKNNADWHKVYFGSCTVHIRQNRLGASWRCILHHRTATVRWMRMYEELFDEKTNTQKSHDTVPLRNLTNMYEKNWSETKPARIIHIYCHQVIINCTVCKHLQYSGYLSRVDKTTCNINSQIGDTWGKQFVPLKSSYPLWIYYTDAELIKIIKFSLLTYFLLNFGRLVPPGSTIFKGPKLQQLLQWTGAG